MSNVTTARPINLTQLGAELGTRALSCATVGGESTVTAHDATTKAALQSAVDAHVAIDEAGNRTTLEQQAATALANNKSFLAIATPTTAQITAQVKALTRQNNALIRLTLGRLDGTD